MDRRALTLLLIVCFCIGGFASRCSADDVTATSGDWTIVADKNPIWDNGLYQWVDPYDADHLAQNVWWWRSNVEGVSGSETVISGLSIPDNSSNPAQNSIRLEYSHPEGFFDVVILYTLIGTGNTASVTETLNITSRDANYTRMSFFGYSDFDMAESIYDDYVDGDVSGITQSDAVVNATVAVTPTTAAQHFWIADANATGEEYAIYVALEDGNLTTLSDTDSMADPGDGTFAFQWDIDTPVGSPVSITKTMSLSVAPEPVSLVLFPIGFSILGLYKRKRRGHG